MKLTFLGAAGTVTGSKFLLSLEEGQSILVDCGLFQGYKELRLRNWDTLPFSPKNIHAVVLTHAHIDHTGYVPRLVKDGFRGKIYCTQGTKDLCEILLADSAHLQEEDAKYANKHGFSKHKPALPLYTIADVKTALGYFKTKPYNSEFHPAPELNCQFIPAGHIIGASFVHFTHNSTSILFSGDLGRLHDPVMHPPTFMQGVDYLILESTYGDRVHENMHPKILLKKIIDQTIERGGTVIIPAFAVGRSQTMLHYLAELKKEHQIPDVPIFLDSPLSVSATQILRNHTDDHHLTKAQCEALGEVAVYTNTPQQSMELDKNEKPKIIISASGMVTGGRVLHHLKTYASDPKNTILFTGFQAGGTRGADMLKGVKTIKMHGQMLPIQAQIEIIHNLSAHADSNDILEWLKHFKAPPKKVFLVHGEPEAALALKKRIKEELGWTCVIPSHGQTEMLK